MVIIECLKLYMINLQMMILYKQNNNLNNLHHIFQKLLKRDFKYTGTEQNQIFPQKPVLQRNLIEGLPTPIFEYIGRMKHI